MRRQTDPKGMLNYLEQSTTPNLVTEESIDNSAQREQKRSRGVHERANSIRERKYEDRQRAADLFGRAALYGSETPNLHTEEPSSTITVPATWH